MTLTSQSSMSDMSRAMAALRFAFVVRNPAAFRSASEKPACFNVAAGAPTAFAFSSSRKFRCFADRTS